jgi:ABC-type lipoprotein export system ATPase subunit
MAAIGSNLRKGKTVIMVTHDPRAASYATRKLLADKGELVNPPPELAA